MAESQVRLKQRSAQIQITILQTQVLAGQGVRAHSFELEGKRARVVENVQRTCTHLHFAGCQLWIALILVTQSHFAANGDDVFSPQLFRFRVRCRRLVGVKNYLCDAFTVTQIDKDQSAVVAHGMYHVVRA